MPVWITVLLVVSLTVIFTLPAWWPEPDKKNEEEEDNDKDERK